MIEHGMVIRGVKKKQNKGEQVKKNYTVYKTFIIFSLDWFLFYKMVLQMVKHDHAFMFSFFVAASFL